jgi:3-oxoacyl-[acyl-carrier protein] reductase
MDLGLRGKVAVVTGGSRGIGRAIALRMADEGAGVAICARGEPALRAAEDELRARSVPVFAEVCDVSRAHALDDFLDAARRSLRRVDILVHNPSGIKMADDEAAWESTLSVDLMGAVRASQKVVPWMSENDGGAITFISSIAGLQASGFPASYGASKAALISLGKSLAVSLAPQKIRVNTIAPGSIEFPGGVWDHAKRQNPDFYGAILQTIPWGRMGTAEEVADAVVYLSSPRASWITGACIVVDGGQHKGNL